jgi:hypothetical protein
MKVLIAIIALMLITVAGLAWVALHWTYSDGQRAGYV